MFDPRQDTPLPAGHASSPRKPRVLVVGDPACPALRQTLLACRPLWLAVNEPHVAGAYERLSAGELFDATLLLAELPRSLAAGAHDALREAGNAGEVVTVAGLWFEGSLRHQNKAGDPSVVYWHSLIDWLQDRWLGVLAQTASRVPRVVLVSSRDRDAAAAIADALTAEGPRAAPSVVWSPRGGRAPFVSRVDAAVWVGGQLNGPATAELAEFVKRVGNPDRQILALLDFPRHDEIATARAVGVETVLAKPWTTAALRRALRPKVSVGVVQSGPSFRDAA